MIPAFFHYGLTSGAWLTVGRAVMFFLILLKMFFFGRWAPLETYGVYSYILAVIAIVSIFSLPGINLSVVKSITQKKEGVLLPAWQAKMRSALIGSAVLLAFSLYYFYRLNYELGWSFLVTTLFFPLAYASNIFVSFWQGRKDFARQSQWEVSSLLINLAILLPVIFWTNNIVYILLAFLLGQSIGEGFFFWLTLRQARGQNDPRAILFGRHLTVVQAITIFSEQIDRLIVWFFLGAIPLATYAFALSAFQRLGSLIPFLSLALPKMAERKRRKKDIIIKMLWLFPLVIPISLFLFWSAPIIFRYLFPLYTLAVPFFQSFSFLLIFAPFALIKASLISSEKKKELYLVSLLTLAVKITSLVSILFWGIWGVVVAVFSSALTESCLLLYFFLSQHSVDGSDDNLQV